MAQVVLPTKTEIQGINTLSHSTALTALFNFEGTVDSTRGVRGTFSRASNANNPATLALLPQNAPSYVPGKFGQAISIWEGTTNLVYNSDFETVTTTATLFSDPLTSGAAWTTPSGSFTYSSSGATSGANSSIITAGNNAWKPLLGSDGSTSLPLTAQATVVTPSTLSTGIDGQAMLYQDINNYYEAFINNNSFLLSKVVGGTYTGLASASQTIAASTAYTITLELDHLGNLTAKLYSGSGTGGTLLQTLTATDTSLSGGFLVGVGGDTGVVVSNASMTGPIPDAWAIAGQTQYIAIYTAGKENGAYSLQLSADGVGGGGSGQGSFAQTTLALTNGTVYAVSFYAKLLSGSSQLHSELYGGVGGTSFTLTSEWARYIYFPTASSTSGLYFWLDGAGSVLIDCIQVEQKAYATPYVQNNSTTATATRAAETLTVPGGLWNATTGTARMLYQPQRVPSAATVALFDFGQPASRNLTATVDVNGHLNVAYGNGGNGQTLVGTTVLQVDTSYDIAITWAASGVVAYIDGTQEVSGSVAPSLSVPGNVYIGSAASQTNQIDGTIDSFALFNRALTAAEVSSLYAAKQPLIDALESPIAPDTAIYGESSTNPDANDVYTTVTYTRRDGTTYMVSTLSGTPPSGTSQYPTMTWTYYAADGVTVTRTQTFSLTYDASGKRIGASLTN